MTSGEIIGFAYKEKVLSPRDELADVIADKIKESVIEYHEGRLPCELDDACVELAWDMQDYVTRQLTPRAK